MSMTELYASRPRTPFKGFLLEAASYLLSQPLIIALSRERTALRNSKGEASSLRLSSAAAHPGLDSFARARRMSHHAAKAMTPNPRYTSQRVRSDRDGRQLPKRTASDGIRTAKNVQPTTRVFHSSTPLRSRSSGIKKRGTMSMPMKTRTVRRRGRTVSRRATDLDIPARVKVVPNRFKASPGIGRR